MTSVTAGLKWEPLTFIPTLITTASPIPVEIALISNLSDPSDVKFVAIIPDPTIAKPNMAVPRNSIPIAR